MTYWLTLPFALFMLSPLWLQDWGGTYVGDKFQMYEEAWDADTTRDGGRVRTSEGMVGPPRN